MVVNSAAYRELKESQVTFIVDGVVLDARSDDVESYLVRRGDGKLVDGYLVVVIRTSDGFPVTADIAESDSYSSILVESKPCNRRLKRFERLANFLVPRHNKCIVRRKKPSSFVSKESETEVFLRLLDDLVAWRVVRGGDIFVGDTVFGSRRVREALSRVGCLVASPVNEANYPDALRFVFRVRDAAVCLLQRLDFSGESFLSSDEFHMACALSVLLENSLSSLSTPLGSIKMRHVDSLVGFVADLDFLMLFSGARRKRSSVGEGFNAVLKTPYRFVNRGKKLHVKGKGRVRRLIRHKITVEQLLRLGKLIEAKRGNMVKAS